MAARETRNKIRDDGLKAHQGREEPGVVRTGPGLGRLQVDQGVGELRVGGGDLLHARERGRAPGACRRGRSRRRHDAIRSDVVTRQPLQGVASAVVDDEHNAVPDVVFKRAIDHGRHTVGGLAKVLCIGVLIAWPSNSLWVPCCAWRMGVTAR